MTVRRLIAIVFIFFCVTLAWAALGTSVTERTRSGYDLLGGQVEQLWGSEHLQRAPTVVLTRSDGSKLGVGLESSALDVDLELEHRQSYVI